MRREVLAAITPGYEWARPFLRTPIGRPHPGYVIDVAPNAPADRASGSSSASPASAAATVTRIALTVMPSGR